MSTTLTKSTKYWCITNIIDYLHTSSTNNYIDIRMLEDTNGEDVLTMFMTDNIFSCNISDLDLPTVTDAEKMMALQYPISAVDNVTVLQAVNAACPFSTIQFCENGKYYTQTYKWGQPTSLLVEVSPSNLKLVEHPTHNGAHIKFHFAGTL